ncbi:ATP-binding protein [Cohnella thailandensis]|uniref:histidine kinase n=1 Tax=Cohnella thailandensis TaxID=557557 RepID=A0A841T935_9BACL|nr:ATP-binding protein [Cohnella thailandensis]MBB6637711.1 hypothetical protein [Cohnella thailandensis]MBP1974112.1 two-component system sporulation sensor kinase B [Cohnella thailandensis]
MSTYARDFVLNLLIVFSPLVFYPFLQKTRSNKALFNAFLFGALALALAATMCFPIQVGGLSFDMRSIPLAVGALYGGWTVALPLYATVLLVRHFLDSPNEWLYAFSFLPSFVVCLLTHLRFQSSNLWGRIGLAMILCTLIKLLTLSLYLFSIGQFERIFNDSLLVYLQQMVSAGVYVYMIETFIKYNRIQEEIVRSEKLKIVGDMAASVAHEIRNPLTSVRGFLQLISSAELEPAKRAYYTGICVEELNRAERIIADYLSLAKPEPECTERIDLNEELVYVANVLQSYATYNNVDIQLTLRKEEELLALGDRHKFRQALINISKNAVEAMEGGGTLILRSDRRAGRGIVLVADSGKGMDSEQIKRLGTPYYSMKDKGTGLGTMVSFNIIKKMNGKIEIDSVVGQGTEFRLSFPPIPK